MKMVQEMINEMSKNFLNKKEEVVKLALLKHGFSFANDAFFATYFTWVRREGDNFEHLYYRHGHPEETRIISIELTPSLSPDVNTFNKGPYSIKIESKYY